MAPITGQTIRKAFIVGTIMACILLVEVGDQGQATILLDQSQVASLTRGNSSQFKATFHATPPSQAHKLAFTYVKSAPPPSVFLKKTEEMKPSSGRKKRLGLTLFFLGVLADKS